MAVDPLTVDPKTILATIASDPSAPAGARVAAAKALLLGPADAAADEDQDALSVRALRLLRLRATP
jgi:hypothetical protein